MMTKLFFVLFPIFNPLWFHFYPYIVPSLPYFVTNNEKILTVMIPIYFKVVNNAPQYKWNVGATIGL